MKDQARAKSVVYGVIFTIVGALITVLYAKNKKNHGYNKTDEDIKKHFSYSKAHQEMAKNRFTMEQDKKDS